MEGHRVEIPDLASFIVTNVRATGRELGRGAYGSVEEVEIPGAVCAAKKIHNEFLNIGSREDISYMISKFASECRLMSTLRHPHIVQFLGVCYLPGERLPSLIMERLDTNLHDLLETTPNLPLAVKNSILLDTARGLLYLHSQSPPIIHRDLTARNVLLNSAMVAKIADLGVARIVNLQPDQLATMTQGPGNIVYMPPEAMGEHTQYNTSLDIFSFGNIALFTLTQKFIGPKLKAATYTDDAGKINARSEIERREYGFRAIYRDLGKENALAQLTRDCLQNHPAGRPNAADLVERIKKISSPVVPPSKLELMKQLSSKREEISQMADKIKHEKDQMSLQQISLREEIENNHIQLKELREVVRTQEEQIQSIEKKLADMLAQGSVSSVEARQLQAEIEKMKVRVLLELTEKLNQFCLTANKLPGVGGATAELPQYIRAKEVSTPTISSLGPTGTLYPKLMADYTIISMQDKALAPPTPSIGGGGDLQALLPQAKKLSELLQTNVSALETLVMKSAKGTITISSNHALIKIARPAEYEKDDIVLFHSIRMLKSGALFPAVLHLEKPRPYIFMDVSSFGVFGIRPGRIPEIFLGELVEKPRKLKFEDHKDIAAEFQESTGFFYRVRAKPTTLKFSAAHTSVVPARPPPHSRTGSSSEYRGSKGFGNLFHHHKKEGKKGTGFV